MPAVRRLLRDHDAVFLGPGLGADARLGIPGEDGPGVVGATAWLETECGADGVAAAEILGYCMDAGGSLTGGAPSGR